MKTLYIYILFFYTSFANAQTLKGIVTSEVNTPLENATIIAKAIDSATKTQFTITDHLGRYKLELNKETNYTITVNYMGYESFSLEYNYQNAPATYDFILTPKDELLEEIVIDYDYQPVIVKKDTLVYDVAAFMNGTERKLKDQLQKLPGVEVTDSGKIKVQGKTVTQFMVEGNSFFGGGTKLGVENIPADAVDKVEVIDHFTEVAHMKEVSGSDDLAMNIKLKEDKKKFVFGDIRAGYGNNKYYDANATTFYYSSRFNWSFITNANNFGSQQLTYDDVNRFEGFKSVFVRSTINQQQLINLYTYLEPNTNVLENKNQFIASDIRYAFSKKWGVKGVFLMNKNWIRSQTEQYINYLQSDIISFENRWSSFNQRNRLLSGKIIADYKKDKNTTFNYNLQFAATNNNNSGNILSQNNNSNNKLDIKSNSVNFSLSQLFEYLKTINRKHKTSFGIVHSFNKETPQYNWFSNQAFLSSYIPWQTADNYILNEIQSVNKNTIQINAKHYWIAAKKHHFYTTLGYNGTFTNLSTQNNYTNNSNWNNLEDFDFGNQLTYRLNNPFAGIEYKFLYKKFNATLGVFAHHYQLQNTYPTQRFTFEKSTIESEVRMEYEFNKSENIVLNYSLSNNYLGAENYANRWQVNSFNTLFKGNALLQNLQYKNASLRYSKFNMYSGINMYASVNYNQRSKNIRNQVELNGIDQLYTTVMSNQPDTNIDFSTYASKRFKKIELNANTSLGFSTYTQVTNNIDVPSKRNSQSIGSGFKTLFKQAPNINLSYTKSFSQLYSSFDNKTNTDWFSAKVESKFLKHFIAKADYNWSKTSFQNTKTIVEQANAYFEFHKENSAWTFMLKGNNLLNTGIKNEVSFSDFTTSNTIIHIFPRAILFSVQYKL